MKILVTGAAGFIGFHLTKRLLENNEMVIGIDNLNDYYDVSLKYARLKELGIEYSDFKYNRTIQSLKYPNFQFVRIDIADKLALSEVFRQNGFQLVCNLAAQAGVMYSTINPNAFVHSNIAGFMNVLECCEKYNGKLVYASSSSVYGDNKKLPFSENDTITTPKNLYAKTKVANECLAKMYSEHFGIQTIGLRFFSVYGSFGRPDMAYMLFTKAILNHLPINIYGNGAMKRDYTFIDDVVVAVEKIIAYSFENQFLYKIFNVGSSNPVGLLELVEKLEKQLGVKAIKNFQPQRLEEIDTTFADCSNLEKCIGYKPNTSIDKGLNEFTKWYGTYFEKNEKTKCENGTSGTPACRQATITLTASGGHAPKTTEAEREVAKM